MRSEISVFVATCFAITFFSGLSLGQIIPQETKSDVQSSKSEKGFESWLVVFTDSINGNTKKILPADKTKLKVYVSDSSNSFARRRNPDKLLKRSNLSATPVNKTPASNKLFERINGSSKIFPPTASQILVNPLVRFAPLKLSKNKKEQ